MAAELCGGGATWQYHYEQLRSVCGGAVMVVLCGEGLMMVPSGGGAMSWCVTLWDFRSSSFHKI